MRNFAIATSSVCPPAIINNHPILVILTMAHSSTTPLIYALKDGHLVGIDDVPNGSRCGCVCPKCGEKLVARNGGTRMQHHFAHSADSTCVGSAETTLHLLAKEVLQETGRLMLPDYYGYTGTAIDFDEIILEERQEDSHLRLDCIGVKNGHRLWIEIKVNHAVDEEKLRYIREHKQGCVEIDFSRFLEESYTREYIRRFLAEDKSCKEWLYIAGYYEKYEAAQLSALAKERESIKAYLEDHPGEHVFPGKQCASCPYHSTRSAISQLLHDNIPEYRDMIAEIEKLSLKALKRPLVRKGEYPKGMVICGDSTISLYNIYKEESKGRRLYYFFRTVLPTEATRLGETCRHRVFQTSDGSIICRCPHFA